ncbi:hypothetical protein QBC35DRAFT_554269 [Podospora australis]|uniref:Uncharacterized protein n=1 Tax=Podospora australis TaxID=1536484 RepID=A0AAN7AH23_9PEZI|nr:hypothetical protein QBC35DRAFT_554269 [Podospora australis]
MPTDLNKIAQEAERDLNSYSAKTGHGRTATSNDTSGINEANERKFPGSTAKVGDGDDLITNRSYNRRIPGDEGGDRDDKGRWLHGSAYEGNGGPEDKTAHIYQHNPGKIDESIVKGWGKDPKELERETLKKDRPDLLSPDEATSELARARGEPFHWNETAEQGRRAAKRNVGLEGSHSREELPPQGSKSGSKYKGSNWENVEAVPDESADQGLIMPESAVERSRNI